MARARSLRLAAAALLPLLAALPFACATPAPADLSEEGAGGAAGAGGSPDTTSTTTTSTGTGPCVGADDCAALTDACNQGTCINGACTKVAANDGVGCDDGKTCTTNDHCEAGQCTGDLMACPASDACHVGMCDVASDTCVEVPGNDGAGCVDSDPCTLTAFCQAGTCVGGQQVDCSFLDSICGVGVCDPAVGCISSPQNDGTPCDDGQFCTVSDACQGGMCTGAPKACAPPGDVCQIGSCNEVTDTCLSVPGNDGGACDDGNACTTGETCANGGCAGGQPTNANGACDDHDACTTVDTCNANGQCVGSGSITQCIDEDGCCPGNCDVNNDSDCVPACCGDDQNPNAPDNNCFQGATWIAWEYIPSCGYNLTRLELHTDSGSVALLSDNNDFPGGTLFQGSLGAPNAQGWLGADVNPPIALTGGQRYWIAENVGMCSTASSGTMQTYYGSFNGLAGPWDGPFQGHFWTSHAIGECGP